MTKDFCDYCHEEINKDEAKKLTLEDWKKHDYTNIDLCDKCFEVIKSIIKERIQHV